MMDLKELLLKQMELLQEQSQQDILPNEMAALSQAIAALATIYRII